MDNNRESDDDAAAAAQKFILDHFSYLTDPSEYVPALSTGEMPRSGAKFIAHYLPQYYPTPENDAWWGKGFTEWTNVTRARPQFVGHYQPHLPGELGFYDLRVPGIQEQQVRLARNAGLSAFSFYFYWFDGKTLLEAPIRSFAENKNIDFEFCLCWANEDWSRIWSGNSEDILLSQAYSADDDYAFIAHVAQYFRNEKYLRIDGKPLLNVWRSEMLPDAIGTVRRWREWCRANGIGEIHVSRAETYARLDPVEHGMDSGFCHSPGDTRWIEPNIAHPKVMPALLNPNFKGQVFDYDDLVRRAHTFVPPDYPVFRSVCPSWDNQARRPGNGRMLLGAEPRLYLEYLETVIDQTVADERHARDELVYINAWNEWGEGAHLEPDRRYGYALLEATKMADLRVALRRTKVPEPSRIAIVVHVHYIESLGECLDWIADFDAPHDVFITGPAENRPQVELFLKEHGLAATVIATDNRGRDVAPFLHVLAQIDFRQYGRIVKLHTKSDGNNNGAWRNGLLRFLTEPDTLKRALEMLDDHPEIGILGPSEFLVSMRRYLGRNEPMVHRLAERMGETTAELDRDAFFAGTMFIARTRALLPLAALGITLTDFEPEDGQNNGTLAHAMERAITYSAKAAGLTVAGLNAPMPSAPDDPTLVFEGRTSFPFVDMS